MVKKLYKISIAVLLMLLLLINIVHGHSSRLSIDAVLPQQPFTAANATTAFRTFNTSFYSKSDKLYYATTEKKDLGAIWTQAIYWDLVMDAYKRTNDPALLNMINDMYQGGYNRYDHYNWNNKTVWFIYDDMMWWIISLARAHQLTGNADYLNNAIKGFQHVYENSYDPVNGGMWWDFKHSGKNACINFPTVIAAVTLYNITKDTSYLNKAINIYQWALPNLCDSTSGRVADNNIKGNKGWSDYTYNQGTFIGAAVMLYQATGQTSYLNNAIAGADYTWKNMSDKNGMLPAEGSWNEQGVLKAIFGHYIMTLVSAGQQQYLPWLRGNISNAWAHRDVDRGIMYRDYSVACPPGIIQSYEASSAVEMMQVVPPQ